MVNNSENPCPDVGSKIRSKGTGQGLGYGQGKGPIGVPYGEKTQPGLTGLSGGLWPILLGAGILLLLIKGLSKE